MPRERGALAFYSATELPLVVAITTIAVDAGHMKPRPRRAWSAPRCSRR